MKTEQTSALRSLANALSLEVGKLEALRATAGMAMSFVIVLISVSVIVRSTPDVGGLGFAIGATGVVWFAFAHYRLKRQGFHPVMGWITIVIENALPWTFYGILGALRAPADAHHDWGPLLLYCGVLVTGILRLSPRYSLLMGVIGTSLYLAVTALVLMPRHQAAGGDASEFTVAGEITRVCMLMGAAAMVAWVTRGLRTAVGGVVRSIRAADLFGKYRLEKPLAEGGMGTVWLATYCPEGGFARPAAIKLVHGHLVHDQTFLDSFRQEAELGARLVHHNIVQVFDFGTVDDRVFLAMEFVDGPTLREVMRNASDMGIPIPPTVASAIIRGVLAALTYAHAEARDSEGALLRIIHRDLAPANVLLTRGGAVKLTDFGIARALRDSDADHTTTVAGHIDHMAPEQAMAAPLDERTDIFCCGILLWELLCGRPLFLRSNQPATLLAITMAEIPKPSQERAELAMWDDVVMRALDRDPAARFQTAVAMAGAVRAVAGDASDDTVARFLAYVGDLPFNLNADPDATFIEPRRVAPASDTIEIPP